MNRSYFMKCGTGVTRPHCLQSLPPPKGRQGHLRMARLIEIGLPFSSGVISMHGSFHLTVSDSIAKKGKRGSVKYTCEE